MLNEIKKYIEAGLIVIPVDKAKRPLLGGWQSITIEDCRQPEYLNHFKNPNVVVGLQCGGEQNIQALDFDLKYDIAGDLMQRYTDAVKLENAELLDKIYIQQTPSKGYHFIFKCADIKGNEKLARRPSTREELINSNTQCAVLIETRAQRGQVLIPPSPNYITKRGSLLELPTITKEERELLFTIARSFNTFQQPHLTYTVDRAQQRQQQAVGETIFEQFNRDTQAGLDLLEYNGWTVVGKRGEDILLRRPGHTTAIHSAYYHTNSNIFVAFTSSSEFTPEKGYNNSQILYTIEQHREWSQTANRLKEMGYSQEVIAPAKKKEEPIEENDLQPPVLADIENTANYLDYFEKSRTGGLVRGKTTGSPLVDEYFLFKRGNLVVVNGHPNVGKSLVVWFFAALSSYRHGWRWLIFSSENHTGQVIKKFMEFLACKPFMQFTKEEVLYYKERIDEYFMFVKIDKSYTVDDLLRIATDVIRVRPIQGFMIDPYSSLTVKGNGGHQYHYDCITNMRAFSNRTGCGIWLNVHPQASAARNRTKDGVIEVPHAADAENGAIYFNRCDDFITVHRLVNDEVMWKQTQLHIRKIKDTETGGRVTPYDSPVIIQLKNGCRFVDNNSNCLMTGTTYVEGNLSGIQPNTAFDNVINYSEPTKEQIPYPLDDENLPF